jgi:hypothetical protein
MGEIRLSLEVITGAIGVLCLCGSAFYFARGLFRLWRAGRR